MKYLCIRFFVMVFLCLALPGMAFDFGLVVQQTGEFNNAAGDGETDWDLNYTGSYSPWLSAALGKTTKLYLSAKMSMEYEAEEWNPKDPPVLPELGRSEFSWHPVSSFYLEAGRLPFQDPADLIVAGLFDGFNGSVVLGKTRLSVGAFYTGFLYKENAKIIMTPGDLKNYAAALDYADMDTYFASRRVLVSATGEFPELTPRTTLTLNALGQFDVNQESLDGDSRLNTQYLTIRYTVMPLETLSLAGAVVGGLAEDQAGDIYAHFAAAAEADWEVPGAPQDMAQIEFRWSSGRVKENENITAFMPITSTAQGQVFSPKPVGLDDR
jgi:hypothetical protein